MGAIIITYQDDKIWVASKALAKLAGQKHDWTVVMTYYNLGGGLHVKLEFIDKENINYRFLANTDNGKCVCLDKNKHIVYLKHDDVLEYRKFFEFIEDSGELTESEIEEPINGFYKVRYIV